MMGSEKWVHYHVYPSEIESIIGSFVYADDDVVVDVFPGGNVPSGPVGMVYIHGSPETWLSKGLYEWLQTSVISLLGDESPARVVWHTEDRSDD